MMYAVIGTSKSRALRVLWIRLSTMFPPVRGPIKPADFESAQARLGEPPRDQPFLMGEMMTIPDMLPAHCAHSATNAKLPVTDDRVTAHRDRMISRPAFPRASER